MPGKVKLRVLVGGAVISGVARKKDDVVLADPREARELVAAGRAAEIGVLVRAIRANVFGNTWHEVGDEWETGEAQALLWHGQGTAVVVDPRSVAGPLPTPPVIRAPVVKPSRYAGEPRVTVRVLRGFLADGTSYDPGAEPEIPESCAVYAVQSGAAEFTGLRKLSERAMRYMENLAAKNLSEPASY